MPAEGALRDGTPAGFELIETLRWGPATGFVRLERHLERLAASAAALGFVHDPKAVEAALDTATGGAHALRVRLTLADAGIVNVTTAPFEPLSPGSVWTLRIAQTRLASSDPLLRHKTTRRTVYDAARAEFTRDEADEVLLLNERGEICEGTITSLFVDMGDGHLLTPPLASGLLEGVLRGELLAQGAAREAIITQSTLSAARAIHVGNSLRGLIAARLAL